MYGINSTQLQETEEMMHDIDIFPEDWGGGHEQSLRHDFHLITSAKPRTATHSKRDPAGGVSMMMSKHMWSACADTSESHSPQRKRIVWATFFREKGSPLVIIGVYAPSHGHSNPTVAEFQDDLQEVLTQFANCQIFLFGDLNVQLARDTDCTGHWSVHAENSSTHSQSWAEFLTHNELFVVSTGFQPSHRGGTATWLCRDAHAAGRTNKRVTNDYAITSNSQVPNCTQSRARWGPSIRRHKRLWDHAMVESTFKVKIKYHRPKAKMRWDVVAAARGAKPAGAHHDDFRSQVQKIVDNDSHTRTREVLAAIDVSNPRLGSTHEVERCIANAVRHSDKILVNAYRAVVPKAERDQRPTRWNSAPTRVIAEKHAKIQRRYTAQGRTMSKSKQRKLDKERYHLARKLWTEFMQGIIQEARSAAKAGNMAGLYKAIRRIPRSGKKRFQQTTKDALGKDYTVIEDALADWFGFAKRAYAATAAETLRDDVIIPPMPVPEHPITDARILKHAHSVKTDKATGTQDEAPIEAILACEHTTQTLLMIIRIMYDTAVIPPIAVRSIIVMLYKSKGKTNDKNSYRPVSLLRAAMKVLTSIVYEDMDKECSWYIPPSQCGGRKRRSTRDAILAANSTIRRAIALGIPISMLLTDYKAAFTSMSQKLIFAALKEARASDKTLHLVHRIYSQAEAQVRVNMAGKIALTESFPVDRGSLQGDKLACMLYELGQAKLLIDNDPGRGKQRLCPNPRQPDWQCEECQVTSEKEHVPSLNWRAGHRLSTFRHTGVSLTHTVCPTCSCVIKGHGQVVAARGQEFVDDNLLLEEIELSRRQRRKRVAARKTNVTHTPATRIAPRLTRARAGASAPDTNTAVDPESDENADSSGMKPYYNSDTEEEYGVHTVADANPPATNDLGTPAHENSEEDDSSSDEDELRMLQHRAQNLISGGVDDGDIPVRPDKCAHLHVVADLPDLGSITELDVRNIGYKVKCRGCCRPEKNQIAVRAHQRSCYWVRYIDNVMPHPPSSSSSDSAESSTESEVSPASSTSTDTTGLHTGGNTQRRVNYEWSVRQCVDVRGGGDHPRFWLIWWGDTKHHQYDYPSMGNGTNKMYWVIDQLVSAASKKKELLDRLRRHARTLGHTFDVNSCIEAPAVIRPHNAHEVRCKWCNRMDFSCEDNMLRHIADGCCPAAPTPRLASSAAARDARRIKLALYLESLSHLTFNGVPIQNYLDTKYLGHILSADGSNVPDVENRIAQMRAAFNRHTHLWKSTLMDIHLKFEMYEAMLAILTYGCEGWILDKDIRRKLNGFNSQCCARISGRTPHEEAGKPSYNLIYHIMHIRWKYAGQLLRAECDNIARRELLLTALMVIHKRISHKGTLLMHFQFETSRGSGVIRPGLRVADVARAAGWQDPTMSIDVATPILRAATEKNQQEWEAYGMKLKAQVKQGLKDVATTSANSPTLTATTPTNTNPAHTASSPSATSAVDAEASPQGLAADAAASPQCPESQKKPMPGRHKPLDDKTLHDKAVTKARIQQQPPGSVFIFTDGTDTPAKDAHTATNVCGWGLTIQLADPAKGTGWGKCLARRFGPVRLDPQHPAFVGAIEFDNNVAELNALIQGILAILAHPIVTKHVVFVTDSQISIDLLTQTYTSHRYVALSLVAIDLLGLLKLQGTTYDIIHVRGHTGDPGNESADIIADLGGLSSGGRPDSTVHPPAELPYLSVITHVQNQLVGSTDAELQGTQPPDDQPRDTVKWSANTLLHLASGRPIQNYVKPSYPQRTAAEWRKYNAMKNPPRNCVERSMHRWCDDMEVRNRRLGYVKRMPAKPKRWIHGQPELERWWDKHTTNEQRLVWREYYDNLVITGQADSVPPDSWYEQSNAQKVQEQRQHNQQQYMSPPIPLSQPPPATTVQTDTENALGTPPTPLAQPVLYTSSPGGRRDSQHTLIPDTPSSTSTASPMKWDEDTQVDHPLPPAPTDSQPTGTWHDSLRAGWANWG
jgi:ribonuclease HI